MYEETAREIILEQEGIMGSIARDVATQVGVVFSNDNKTIKFSRDPKKVINDLISGYSIFFGRASIELSREAVQKAKSR